ncbi:MAG: cell wall hydrolase [Gammaproteobacteria bacterium]|jgi:N-acetylmuramoyl-L-alanine amidase|nr:cell wall hydrolase [Gammaproteobacteria bacterium]
MRWFWFVFSLIILSPASPLKAQVIVIDTGHSLAHYGALSASGKTEFSFNQRLAKLIADNLTQAGHQVIRMGEDGKMDFLLNRVRHTDKANLFVSIHHDSIQQAWQDAGRQHEFSGYAVFVSTENPYYHDSLRCALAIGQALQAAGKLPSLYHATAIPGENRPLLDAQYGIHRYDNLAVLKKAQSPAILIEAGVIVNPIEERQLLKPQQVKLLAKTITNAIHNCLS